MTELQDFIWWLYENGFRICQQEGGCVEVDESGWLPDGYIEPFEIDEVRHHWEPVELTGDLLDLGELRACLAAIADERPDEPEDEE